MDEKQKRERKWRLTQSLPFALPILGAMALWVFVLLVPIISDYSPASPEKVTEVLTELGYAPYERTESLCDSLGIKSGVKATVTAESGPLEIDFFQLEDRRSMTAVREILGQYIIARNWGHSMYGERDFRTMSCSYNGEHIMYVQVRNTILLLHYDAAHTQQVTDLLNTLDYPGADRLP